MARRELFHHYAEKKDSEAVLRTCRRYSEADPQLWVRALRYFAAGAGVAHSRRTWGAAAASFQLPAAPAWSSAEGTREASVEKQWRAQIGEVIGVRSMDELLSPTEMLERLATRGGRVPLSVAWECLERHLRTTEASSVELARESQRASEELGKMWTEIYEIDEGSRVFQMAQCSACGGALEVPTVHFLCMHSFHQSCLGEQDQDCPLCLPQHKRVVEHRAATARAGQGPRGFLRRGQTIRRPLWEHDRVHRPGGHLVRA